jgi:hypothetical protein
MNALRRLFGPSRQEIWRQLSAEIDGRYVGGSLWKGDKVQATHGEWTVTLDTYIVPAGKTFIQFTRMRAPYVNVDGFRFSVYRKSIFSGAATWLGMQDIEIGNSPFDDEFVIKGTDEARVRTLFSNPTLRDLIAAQHDIHLTVKDDEGWFSGFPEGVDELYFSVRGIIKDVARLKQLYELFAETLDTLTVMGAAYDRDPGVTL